MGLVLPGPQGAAPRQRGDSFPPGCLLSAPIGAGARYSSAVRFLAIPFLASVSTFVACASEPQPPVTPVTPTETPATAPSPEAASAPSPPPAPDPVALPAASASAVATGEPAAPARPRTLDCRCDVFDLESNGPAKTPCTWSQAEDGTVSVVGAGSPKFSGRLTPVVRPGKANQGFEGEFDFACKQRWCGHLRTPVHPAGEYEWRVTVERSDEGPPRRVLWLSCKAAP